MGKRCQRPCRHYFQGVCATSTCYHWRPTESGCKFGDNSLFKHALDANQPSEKAKESGGEGAVALLKNSTQSSMEVQDLEPLKSKSSRKGPKTL